MENKPAPKGRGALLEMLKKHKEARAGGAGEPVEELIPPKSRGRAALLQKIQEMKEKKVGVGEIPEPVPGPSTLPVQSKRGAVERLTERVSEMSLASSSEPCSYRGEAGTTIRAASNFIRLEVEKDRGVFEYEVRFQPEIDARSNRIKLVNQALGEMSSTKVYDGDVCLYLPSRIISGRQEFDGVIPNTEERVTTILIYKRQKRLGECLHLYNVLFKRIMHILLYSRMGRNYFSPDHKQLVPHHKLEVLPGFAVHVDEMEDGLMICMDTQHRVIRTQTALELFSEIRHANVHRFKEEATKNIIGACVLTKYNNKTYIVDDIAWDMCPTDTFETRGGGQCTFVDYYKHHYNIQIQDVEQPMLINRQTRTFNEQKVEHMVCLVPELCYLTGLTDAMRSDFKVMKDVAVYTRVTPNHRALALRTWLERVRNSETAVKVLSGWGLRLADGIANLPARVLPPEPVYFGGNDRMFTGNDWNRAIGENKLAAPMDILSWQLYFVKADSNNAQNFAETIVRLGKGMGSVIREPELVRLNDDRADTYMTAIRDHVTPRIQAAVFICPTIRVDRYSIIKKMCCVNQPLASQVILSKTLRNPAKVRTIIHKIGMQIICKLGGSLWSVRIPVAGWMICGIDVYHGANNQSVCGFVASMNDSHTRYYSEAVFQDREVGEQFRTPFHKALEMRKESSGSYPSKVIIFRDGVGDGQLDHCLRFEVSQFLDVIREMGINTTVTFIVVQKRISTRIFQATGREYENPPAGTVVDTTVTRRNLPDFFLVPQSVRQGTVNPTHYIVVHDSSDMKPDHVQRLAYKLCHLYYNWSGPIRVPAPCLYAHKLASLVGQYIKKTPDSSLSDKLYYL